MSGELDSIDEHILLNLQREGRSTITEMAEDLPVTGNTVRNRIEAMEEAGVITGYAAEVDYASAGLPFHFQFTCTAPIAERSRLVEAAFDIPGVLSIRELMTGQRNVVIEVVGGKQEDITRIAETLDNLGLVVVEENLVKRAETRPLTIWEGDREGEGEEDSEGPDVGDDPE